MEDYIYILGFIAWIAYSFYSAAQKKKKKEIRQRPAYEPAPYSEPQETNKPGRSVFEELFGENFEEIHEEFEEPQINKDSMPEKQIQYYQQPAYQEIEATNHTILVSQLTDSETPVSASLELFNKTTNHSDAFDLRKAVIYGAILERPYK